MKKIAPVVGLVLLFTSCATITRGVHEKLSVISDPPGADVALSTGEKGVTPATFVKNRRGDTFTVTISKPGYVSQTVKVESHGGGTGGTAMAGNALVGGVIGLAVDSSTGAYDSLYPNPVSVKLVKKRGDSGACAGNRVVAAIAFPNLAFRNEDRMLSFVILVIFV